MGGGGAKYIQQLSNKIARLCLSFLFFVFFFSSVQQNVSNRREFTEIRPSGGRSSQINLVSLWLVGEISAGFSAYLRKTKKKKKHGTHSLD